MKRFDNKTVLVTGGNSGIGLATAIQFAAEGARVIITGRDQAALDLASTQIGAGTIALRNDQGDVKAAAVLSKTLRERAITLDAVFINAGVAKFASLEEVGEALWDQTFDINVKGAFFTIQALSPLLNEGAAVILNGSINAHIGMPGSSVYAASKAALISFAKTLSAELIDRGVRVNVVSPGAGDDAALRQARHAGGAAQRGCRRHPAANPAQALRHAGRGGGGGVVHGVAASRFHRRHRTHRRWRHEPALSDRPVRVQRAPWPAWRPGAFRPRLRTPCSRRQRRTDCLPACVRQLWQACRKHPDARSTGCRT